MAWITEGYMPLWGDAGPPTPATFPNHGGCTEHPSFVDKAVADLLASGAVQQVPFEPWVVSPLNVIERRGKLRLVLDLTHVNQFLDTSGTKFRYETISTSREVLQRDDVMFSIDLESAYHHVDMHPDSWEFLGFCWRGQYYVFKVLPFGLSTACWVFTKLTRELVRRWRAKGVRLIHYLDDFLFAIASRLGPAGFNTAQQLVLSDIAAAGFSTSAPKLRLDASHVRDFLGFVLDTQRGLLSVTDTRLTELKATLSQLTSLRRRHIPARLLARACGQLISMRPALGHAVSVFTRGMYAALETRTSWQSHVVLDSLALEEIDFWLKNIDSLNGSPLWPIPVVETLVFSDASDIGWGGHLTDLARPPIAHGFFTPNERDESSTFREAVALLETLRSFVSQLSGRDVRAVTDNLALAWLWLRGSKKEQLNVLIKSIWAFSHQHGIRLAVQWVPREANTLADYISKFYDGDDWKLHPRFFQRLDLAWGPHTVDRFATYKNNHCARFNSLYFCPGTEAIDAFTQHWALENNWINPPFGQIGRVLLHMSYCGAVGTLICPVWPKRPWWPLLCPAPNQWAPFVVDVIELPQCKDLFLPGPKHGNHRAVGQCHWKVVALRLDFSSRV